MGCILTGTGVDIICAVFVWLAHCETLERSHNDELFDEINFWAFNRRKARAGLL